MTPKATRRGAPKGAQPNRVGGDLIALDKDERDRLRNRRQELGLTQPQLATAINVAAATISNLEGGRSRQVRRTVYAAAVRHLFGTQVPVAQGGEDLYKRIVEGLAVITESDRAIIDGLVTSLKNRK
jgi:transcriptional regulator with XRE-family HTH domain